MLLDAINSYYRAKLFKPFYVAVGDDDYRRIKSKLTETGNVAFVKLSECCTSADKKPDLDRLREILRLADVYFDSNKIVLLGLGEYLALEGVDFARKVLSEFLAFNLGSAQAVFLLRGVSAQVKELMKQDIRLDERQIVLGEHLQSELAFSFSSPDLGLYSLDGIKKALDAIEVGRENLIRVNTEICFPESVFPITVVKNPYEAICKKVKKLSISRDEGSDDYWDAFLADINQHGSMEAVFDNYGFDGSLNDFYSRISGDTYHNWLYYIYLLTNKDVINNEYLNVVFQKSSGFSEFKSCFLNCISQIPHTQGNYYELYAMRKKIAKQFPEPEIAEFVINNRFNTEESFFRLTDNTLTEKQEVIADIAQHGFKDKLEIIYPDLHRYIKKYAFNTNEMRDLLTTYFDDYKKQKIENKLDDDFLEQVNKLAVERVYNRLQTRDEIVASIERDGTFLFWIDALGVEYLGYIVACAERCGLVSSVKIGRADLPTITSINKGFYETWPEGQKRKIGELDDVKHKEAGGYKYGTGNQQFAVHLAKELEIISEAISTASIMLNLKQYERCVIASDHGASRLAVLRNKEEKYDTDTQGEHSGRCCKSFDGYDLEFATEENGYIVLADYGRFKGSRAANVEVHGGASLEEVVVPIISLTLKDPTLDIRVLEDVIKADYKDGAALTLYINKTITQSVFVEYLGEKYAGQRIDENHYKVEIPTITKAGEYSLNIFLNDNPTARLSVKAVGKSASVNTDFDDLL